MRVEQLSGRSATELQVRWRKSSHSGDNSNCVEVAALANGDVAVGDSKNRVGPVLILSADEWASFAGALREGLLRP
ncbi:DUF397 domain-containing protein [Sphaerisporangium sp. NPDC049002]|uniref:DUF397 domain-containing protein n=1 Tax=Sphaerisporangium sp. NPDC049002 TaxID=3155392 RepID=UPI00340325FF